MTVPTATCGHLLLGLPLTNGSARYLVIRYCTLGPCLTRCRMLRTLVTPIMTAILVFVGAATHSRASAGDGSSPTWTQTIGVESTSGAVCTFTSEGKVLAMVSISRQALAPTSIEFVTVTTINRADIIITCAREGFGRRATVASFGPSTVVFDNPIGYATCLSSGQPGEVCRARPTPTATVMEYPGVVRLPLRSIVSH